MYAGFHRSSERDQDDCRRMGISVGEVALMGSRIVSAMLN